MSAYGDMKRTKMRDSIDRSMKIRRIRRTWYHLTDDAPMLLVRFLGLVLLAAACAGVWYVYGTATWFR